MPAATSPARIPDAMMMNAIMSFVLPSHGQIDPMAGRDVVHVLDVIGVDPGQFVHRGVVPFRDLSQRVAGFDPVFLVYSSSCHDSYLPILP